MTIIPGNFKTAGCYSGHLAIFLPIFDVFNYTGIFACFLAQVTEGWIPSQSPPFTDIFACFQAYNNSFQDILNIQLRISSEEVDILENDDFKTSRSKYSKFLSPWCYSGPFAKPKFSSPWCYRVPVAIVIKPKKSGVIVPLPVFIFKLDNLDNVF